MFQNRCGNHTWISATTHLSKRSVC